MRPPAARADMRLTYDDFVRFPDDGKRHEIIDGEHVVTTSPNVRHHGVYIRPIARDNASPVPPENSRASELPQLRRARCRNRRTCMPWLLGGDELLEVLGARITCGIS